MKTIKGGAADRLGKGYSPNLCEIERESAITVGAMVDSAPGVTGLKEPAKKRSELSVAPYLEVEESQSGEILYLPQSIIQRRFWYKERIPQFPYNLNRGTSHEKYFLSDLLVAEMEKKYSFKADYYLAESSRRQKIEEWAYRALTYLSRVHLEWNSFFVFDGDFIFELRAYTSNCHSNAVIHFIFHNKVEAEKFVLPEWAKSCIQETTDLSPFSERGLAENGFPDVIL